MVRLRFLLQVYALCLALRCTGLLASPIESIRLASDQIVSAKPCEPVFALLAVDVTPTSDLGTIMRIPRDLASRVTLNGRAYDVEFNSTGLNPVASFALSKDMTKRSDGKIVSCKVIATLLWNYLSDTCLFVEAGANVLEFHPGVRLEVVVEPPTEGESEFIAQLQAMGVEFPAFVMDPHDYKRSKTIAPRIDKLLRDYRDTAHAAFLSVSVGVALLPYPRTEQERGDFDLTEFWRKRVAFGEKYFAPYCDGQMDSLFEAVAAYYLGTDTLKLLWYDSAVSDADRASRREKAIALLERVRDSPYSLGNAAKASAFLRDIAAREVRDAARDSGK